MSTILQAADETQEQALARERDERSKRKALDGYVNGVFIFKGRRCFDGGERGPFEFIVTGVSSAELKSKAELELERDRKFILRNRAVREAVDDNDLFRLLNLYGV